jgi:hypothetical protein
MLEPASMKTWLERLTVGVLGTSRSSVSGKSGDNAQLSASGLHASLARDAFNYFLSKIVPGLMGFLSVLVFVRMLGVEPYGRYAVVFAVVMAWAPRAGWVAKPGNPSFPKPVARAGRGREFPPLRSGGHCPCSCDWRHCGGHSDACVRGAEGLAAAEFIGSSWHIDRLYRGNRAFSGVAAVGQGFAVRGSGVGGLLRNPGGAVVGDALQRLPAAAFGNRVGI